MASSSSSNPSSTPYAARVLSDSERVRPRLPNPAAAPAASAALGVDVPGANASATATAPGVTPSATASASTTGVSIGRPPLYPHAPTARGGSKRVPPPTNFDRGRGHQRGRGDRARNSAGVSQPSNSVGVSQHVSRRKPSEERGWQTAADPTSTFAPSRLSTEGSSAWSKPLSSLTTVASTPTNTTPASAASSSTTPSPDITLVPNASTSSAPGVTTIADPSATTSTPGAAPTASATTSAPGAAPTIPSLRDNWVAVHWGIVPGPRSVERCSGQQPFGGNGMPPVEVLNPDLLSPWQEQVPPRSFGFPLCWACGFGHARFGGRPCGHLALCIPCYCSCIDNSNRFFCPFCGLPVTWMM